MTPNSLYLLGVLEVFFHWFVTLSILNLIPLLRPWRLNFSFYCFFIQQPAKFHRASRRHIVFSLYKGVVTNYGEGGATKREGGAREVLPLRKGGAEKVLAILKGGGHKKFWGRFYAVA